MHVKLVRNGKKILKAFPVLLTTTQHNGHRGKRIDENCDVRRICKIKKEH